MTSRAEVLVRGCIHNSGPISFETFMEVALYSDVGYYSNNDIFGLKGDYYTSPHLHPIFGSMFALQIERMWEILGSPANLYVIEQGAGDGTLAVDISAAINHSFRAVTGQNWLHFPYGMAFEIPLPN